MARITGNRTIAWTVLYGYCAFQWVGDSITAGLYPRFLKAFKPAHLSGITTTDDAAYALRGASGNTPGLQTQIAAVSPKTGAATLLTDYYSFESVTEVQLIAGGVAPAIDHNFSNRVADFLVIPGDDWRAKSPFTEIGSGGGTWRLIYLQHPTSPQNLRVATMGPTTNPLTIGAAGNAAYPSVDFRGDGVRKVTYQDFPVPAGGIYSGTAYPRLAIQINPGAYPSNDVLAVIGAQFFRDRTGAIPHVIGNGGWQLGDFLNPAFSFGSAWVEYLKASETNVVMLMLGQNGFVDGASHKAGLQTFIAKCREADPAMKIILWGYAYHAGSLTPADYTTEPARTDAINAAAESIAVDDPNCLFLNLADEVGNVYVSNLMTSDGVHFSSETTAPAGFGAYEASRAMMQLLREAAGTEATLTEVLAAAQDAASQAENAAEAATAASQYAAEARDTGQNVQDILGGVPAAAATELLARVVDGEALSLLLQNVKAATRGNVAVTVNGNGTLTLAFKKADGTTAFTKTYNPVTGERT